MAAVTPRLARAAATLGARLRERLGTGLSASLIELTVFGAIMLAASGMLQVLVGPRSAARAAAASASSGASASASMLASASTGSAPTASGGSVSARSAAVAAAHVDTYVRQIYPTTPAVPENLLKIYVEFSAPMRDGEAAARLRLLDDEGRALEGALLTVDEELWDPTHRRLTLLLDPGRVKRGLRTHAESGAPLRAGRHVTLAIDRAWPDADGRPLAGPARRRWQVGPPDRTAPRPARWRIETPAAGTTAPLVVHFGEALDRALLARMLRVEDERGGVVSGGGLVEAQESAWRFTPAEPWRAASYTLGVDARLEDLAANRVSGLFDVDLANAHGRATSSAAAPATAASTGPAPAGASSARAARDGDLPPDAGATRETREKSVTGETGAPGTTAPASAGGTTIVRVPFRPRAAAAATNASRAMMTAQARPRL